MPNRLFIMVIENAEVLFTSHSRLKRSIGMVGVSSQLFAFALDHPYHKLNIGRTVEDGI